MPTTVIPQATRSARATAMMATNATMARAPQPAPFFRSVEALLNYIEASYEKNGSLDGTATQYWTRIRERHTGLDADFMKTVNATDIAEEPRETGVLIQPVSSSPTRFSTISAASVAANSWLRISAI